MNYGKKGLQKKINDLESSGTRVGKWAGVSALRIGLVALIAAIVLVVCLLVGAYDAIIDTAPSIADVNIIPNGYATFIYDANGTEIQKLNSAEGNRISVSINEIPENMQHAIVAIEDSRFYQHNGIDPIGLVRAAAVAISSGFQRTEGASTITQQLIKNNVFTNWTTEVGLRRIIRKIQEQYIAVLLEAALTAQGEDTKSVILENYLNTVNFGAGAYGVQTASQTYFGKNVTDLTLSECAVLAAIPQNPTQFNPQIYPLESRERQLTVLSYMLEQDYITEAEYNEAVNDNVYERIAAYYEMESIDTTGDVYSFFVDEVIHQVERDLVERLGYTEVQAINMVYSGGCSIYTTQNSNIQKILEEEFANEANFPPYTEYMLDWALTVDHENGERENYSREMLQAFYRETDTSFDLNFSSEEEAQLYVDVYKASVLSTSDTIVAERFSVTRQPQAAMTVIDQGTGYVVGIIGARGEKTASLTLDRAMDSYRQPGSTFKILSTYGPAIELGLINLATRILDEPYAYTDGTPVNNSDMAFHGYVSVRQAIINSFNVPAVKVITLLDPQVGYNFLAALGFSNLVASTTEGDIIQPLALGGITNGVSTYELASAYAAVANNGIYRKPVFYTKVVDHDGNVLLDNTENRETRQIFSPASAFELTSAMMDVVMEGTGVDFRLDNMTLAGKTGTTSSNYDFLFAGYTPYYTAALWMGSDLSVELPEDYRLYHKQLWRNIMNRIHAGLGNTGFYMPADLAPVVICKDTGLLAGVGCTPYTEYFTLSQIPTETCHDHEPTPTPTPPPTPVPTATPAPTPVPTEVPVEEPIVEPVPEPEPEPVPLPEEENAGY